MNYGDPIIDKMIEYKSKLIELAVSHWINQELFTWQWWFCVFLYIFPLLLWWKIVDRKRLLEIIIFGLFVNVFCSFLDVLGTNYNLWLYSIQIIPNVPLLFPIDYIVIPVVFMILYQIFTTWKSFIISMIITSLVFSFVGEPFDVWAKIYILIKWQYIYSFPIYILIGIICKATVNWFMKKAR